MTSRVDLDYVSRVVVQNLRCFDRVVVPLKPLTVLVGRNDTGKSTFLYALERAARGQSFFPGDGRNDRTATVEGTSISGRAMHQLGGPRGEATQVVLFRLPADGVPMRGRGLPDGAGAPDLDPNGSQVAALLDYLLRNERTRFDEIVADLKVRIDGLQDVGIGVPGSAEEREVNVKLESGVVLPATQASTGVRLMIFFVALLHHPRPPNLILIEEPENGVHPRRVQEIVDILRGVTQGRYGSRAAQVVLSTHSPYLLDFINPGEDQVLVFRREDDGRRTAKPLSTEQVKDFLGEFMLGEVWFNRGEEGLTES